MRVAVFPGSFDPITLGHEDLIRRSIPLFDKIIVAIGVNSKKKHLFSVKQRIEWLEAVFADSPTVEIDYYEGMTISYCNEKGSKFLIRGLRSSADFEYEKQISQLNNILGKGVETIFLISQPGYSHISSSIVREIIKNNGDASPLIPKQVKLN